MYRRPAFLAALTCGLIVAWACSPMPSPAAGPAVTADGPVTRSIHLPLPPGDATVADTEVQRTKRPARRGVVTLDGRAFKDADGPYLGVGASLFWASWGYQYDRPRLEANLRFLADHGVDYIRVLGVVGPQSWTDRTATAHELVFRDTIGGLTDLAYDTYGLRIEWTIFGGPDTTPTAADRERLVRRFIDVLGPRAEKVQFIEIWNEAWGTGGDPAETKRLASLVADATPFIVSTTAVAPMNEDGVDRWYRGSGATLLSVHVNRAMGDGGWQHVRHACDPMLFWRGAWTSNEPIGQGSSVASDEDPLRLAMAAAYTWICNGASYVVHTGAGIRGGGVEDRERGRPSNIWDVPNIKSELNAIAALRALLPPDLSNFAFQDSKPTFPHYPFETAGIVPLVEQGDLLRAFAATHPDGRFVMMPIVAKVAVPFRARYPMHVAVHDPATGALRERHDLEQGEVFTLQPTPAAIVQGQRR